jgi:hypothetical protein
MTFVFNHSAAARILGIKPESILRMEVWASCVVVHIKGQRSTFLSKTRFYSDFAHIRREGAWNCKVEAPLAGYPKQYRVISEGIDKQWHSVWMHGALQSCNCRDFAEQKRLWGKGICKHQYAVLNHLGCASIEEAVAKQQQEWKDFVADELLEAAPVIKPPVEVSIARPSLPERYRHVSIV